MVESQAESKPSHKVDALNLSNLGSRRDTKLLKLSSRRVNIIALPCILTQVIVESAS